MSTSFFVCFILQVTIHIFYIKPSHLRNIHLCGRLFQDISLLLCNTSLLLSYFLKGTSNLREAHTFERRFPMFHLVHRV